MRRICLLLICFELSGKNLVPLGLRLKHSILNHVPAPPIQLLVSYKLMNSYSSFNPGLPGVHEQNNFWGPLLFFTRKYKTENNFSAQSFSNPLPPKKKNYQKFL